VKKKLKLDIAEFAIRTVFRRCILFFLKAGIDESFLRSEFEKSLKWASKKKVPCTIFRVDSTKVAFEICQRWLRHPAYINSAGNPKALPMRGSRSLESIMKELGFTEDVPQTTELMLKIGCIEKSSGGKFMMPTRGFYSRRNGMVPFEPYAQFLIQAVTTATLPIDIKRSDKHSYWLSSTRTNLSEKQITDFVNLVKRKGHSQIVELDEWFLALPESNPSPDSDEIPKNTVGVGMFTFVTEPRSP